MKRNPTARKPETASLVVRRLSPELVDRLKRRAVGNGRSQEAEHRAILEEALKPQTGRELWDFLRRGPRFEFDLEDMDQPATAPDFT